MSEEFVRKDVHNAELRRIDERINLAVSRIEASLAQMSREIQRIDRNIDDLRGKIQSLEGRHFSLGWDVALIAVIFFVSIFLLSISIRFMR